MKALVDTVHAYGVDLPLSLLRTQHWLRHHCELPIARGFLLSAVQRGITSGLLPLQLRFLLPSGTAVVSLEPSRGSGAGSGSGSGRPPPLGEGLQLCVRSATRLSPLPLFIAIDMTPAVSNIAL